MIRRLLYEIRFWRGVDRDSQRLIYDRYEERAPKL